VASALFRLQEAAQRLPHDLLLLLPAMDWLERRWGSGARRRLGFDSCGSKFREYRPLFIGLLVPNHRRRRSYHFPSLSQTLTREDSEEIKKGIKSVLYELVNGYDLGFGSG
jgi:hypothetical protein